MIKYLIDVGSSSIKVSQIKEGIGIQIDKRSYHINPIHHYNGDCFLSQADLNFLLSLFIDLTKQYGFTKTNTRLYATGFFRDLSSSFLEQFANDLYCATRLNFVVISQDLELFYLENIFVLNSKNIGRTIVFNIGSGSTEFFFCDRGTILSRHKLPWGVAKINRLFKTINKTNDSLLLDEIVEKIKSFLPFYEESFENAIYTGGELSFMKTLGYPLKKNIVFSDLYHPLMISSSAYYRFNKRLFDELTLNDLRSKMPNNPSWMDGARACSAIAQAISLKYGVQNIIPSDFNMVNGIMNCQARTATLCGSYTKQIDKINLLIEQLKSQGITILSPQNTNVVGFAGEKNNFVMFEGDKAVNNCTWSVEALHKRAIKDCDMVVICNYDNYIGSYTSFEIGIAQAFSKRIVFVEDNEVAHSYDIPSDIGLLSFFN